MVYKSVFAFPELKIDVEIDGALHLTEKNIARDAERDKWSQKRGVKNKDGQY
jgi:very-short-patch-repair endonuclease